MTRKHTPRRRITPQPPRGLRPRLTREQLLDLGLAHVVNLDVIARGEAGEPMLWDYAGAVLTWSRVAIMLDRGVPEMTAQLGLSARLIERYGRTGRVLFTGDDYQLAKVGLDVMDQLAALVDRPTAIAAANWSEGKVARMVEECRSAACGVSDDFPVAAECQACERWIAHYCHVEPDDGPVARVEPSSARECPLRLAVVSSNA